MADAKFIGSIFIYQENGLDYTVSFNCEEVIDPDTNIQLAIIEKITVIDQFGILATNQVDVEKISQICLEKASETLIRKTNPGFNQDLN